MVEHTEYWGAPVRNEHPRPLESAQCSLCGIELPKGLMMPDGGRACTDIRWYCKDSRSCTERWTARLARGPRLRPEPVPVLRADHAPRPDPGLALEAASALEGASAGVALEAASALEGASAGVALEGASAGVAEGSEESQRAGGV